MNEPDTPARPRRIHSHLLSRRVHSVLDYLFVMKQAIVQASQAG